MESAERYWHQHAQGVDVMQTLRPLYPDGWPNAVRESLTEHAPDCAAVFQEKEKHWHSLSFGFCSNVGKQGNIPSGSTEPTVMELQPRQSVHSLALAALGSAWTCGKSTTLRPGAAWLMQKNLYCRCRQQTTTTPRFWTSAGSRLSYHDNGLYRVHI